LGERKSLTAEIEIVDESSATQLQYSTDAGNSVAVSYMQSVTPAITVGGKKDCITLETQMAIIFRVSKRGSKSLRFLFYHRCRPIFHEKESYSNRLWMYL
jgi:hypothetical protein